MSQYYTPKRTKNIFNPNDSKPFKLSRSKIELFIECQRCFYIDRRLGVGRPPGFPFNLNSSVDALLKNEFDTYRVKGLKHPLIEKYELMPNLLLIKTWINGGRILPVFSTCMNQLIFLFLVQSMIYGLILEMSTLLWTIKQLQKMKRLQI